MEAGPTQANGSMPSAQAIAKKKLNALRCPPWNESCSRRATSCGAIRYNGEGEIIAIRALNIKNERLDLTDIQRISKQPSDAFPRPKVYKNDILITYIGSYIGDVLRIEHDGRFHLAPNVAKVTAVNEVRPQFIEWSLGTSYLRSQMMALTVTTATHSLTMTQIRNLVVPFPKQISEQIQIVGLVESVTRRILREDVQRGKWQELKTGLMQDLLTGKVRMKMDETEEVGVHG
jgi:type I restriction enzyme S subunit